MAEAPARTAFISYSWTSPEHEQWVLDLAKELVEFGVDVKLDKWELREGMDKYAFMERMVTDSSIDKVIMVVDRVYAEKADGRAGGVGTETQILTPELYGQAGGAQSRFVAVVAEHDEQGRPYSPAFYRSRIHIDMSDANRYADAFEQLVRWIYDRPVHQKPAIGKPPAYILSDERVSLGTTGRQRAALDAIRHDRPNALVLVEDYFDTFAENLRVFRLEPNDRPLDELVWESIEEMQPYRDELVEVLVLVARRLDGERAYEVLHRFLEQILSYTQPPIGGNAVSKGSLDNLRFLVQEIFLYTIAVLLKHHRFEGVQHLVTQGYYLSPETPGMDGGLYPFPIFRYYLESLEARNRRLGSSRLSLHSDLLKDRATRSDVSFEEIMQADLILMIRAALKTGGRFPNARWWPDSLLYSNYRRRSLPFELFARAESTLFFDRLKVALGVDSKAELETLVNEYAEEKRWLPRWQFDQPNPATLIGIEHIATSA